MKNPVAIVILVGLAGVVSGVAPARAQGYLMGLDPTMPPVFIAAPYAQPTILVPPPRLVPRPIVRPFFAGHPGYATYYPSPIVHPYQAPRVWVLEIRRPRPEQQPQPEPPPETASELSEPPSERQPQPRGPRVVWIGTKP